MNLNISNKTGGFQSLNLKTEQNSSRTQNFTSPAVATRAMF